MRGDLSSPTCYILNIIYTIQLFYLLSRISSRYLKVFADICLYSINISKYPIKLSLSWLLAQIPCKLCSLFCSSFLFRVDWQWVSQEPNRYCYGKMRTMRRKSTSITINNYDAFATFVEQSELHVEMVY